MCRSIHWIEALPYHPCIEKKIYSFIDEFFALCLYYPKNIFGSSFNEVTNLILSLKKDNRPAEVLGRALAYAIRLKWGDLRDYVVLPAPKHPDEKGGYNQALELAKVVAEELDLTIYEAVVKRKPISSSELRDVCGNDFHACLNLHLGIMDVTGDIGVLKHKGVLLIDDVRTSGATLEAMAKLLKERAKVGRIKAVTLARDAVKRYFTCTTPEVFESHLYYNDSTLHDGIIKAATRYLMWINGRKSHSVVHIIKEIRAGKKLTELIDLYRVDKELLEQVERALKWGVVPITIEDDEYPPLLKSYGSEKVYPPLVLFRLGRPLGALRYVAVVGARDASSIGLRLARELGQRLAEEGYVVVTGFAKGIDEAATTGALEAGGTAVGVAPFLYEGEGVLWYRARRFLESGRVSVVSERLRPSSDVGRDFVLRNRIIAGMSLLVVIPEARYREGGWGTRYQVDFGIRAGKTVVIFKPPVDDEAAQRAYRYFQEAGARTANSVEDVLEILRGVESGNLP